MSKTDSRSNSPVPYEPTTNSAKRIEEEHLSQKMTHLSTNVSKQPDPHLKTITSKIAAIPNFLHKKHQPFRQLLHQALPSVPLTINDTSLKHARQMAVTLHKRKVIQIYRALWTVYLRCEQGQFIVTSNKPTPYATDVPIWPKAVKHLTKVKKIKDASDSEKCLALVQETLTHLRKQEQNTQSTLNRQMATLTAPASSFSQMIENYIEEHIHRLRRDLAHEIEIVQYDYHIAALKLAYEQQNPTPAHMQIMNDLCHKTYEQEASSHEYHFLMQQMAYYNSSNGSFESSVVARDLHLDSIENSSVRQTLWEQYKTTAEQARLNMFKLSRQMAEKERDQCKKTYEMALEQLWTSRAAVIDKDKISTTMIELINQRCQKIAERLTCLYSYKAEWIGTTSQHPL